MSCHNCVTFAESEPYCHSILFACLSGCLSVIPPPTAYHDWSITTKFGRTRVSLFGSPISHTFGARGKNMQNFAYFQRQPFNAYSCHCERDASCHMTCFIVSCSDCLMYCMFVWQITWLAHWLCRRCTCRTRTTSGASHPHRPVPSARLHHGVSTTTTPPRPTISHPTRPACSTSHIPSVTMQCHSPSLDLILCSD